MRVTRDISSGTREKEKKKKKKERFSRRKKNKKNNSKEITLLSVNFIKEDFF